MIKMFNFLGDKYEKIKELINILFTFLILIYFFILINIIKKNSTSKIKIN